MNPFEQMELKKASYTKKEMEVYEVLINNIDDILRDSAMTIAEAHHISQSAITRFCQKLGYQGFNDFKYDVYKYQKSGSTTQDPSSVMDYYAKLLHLIPNAVTPEAFSQLAEMIVSAHFTAINGYHKSSLPAQLLEMNLTKFSIPSAYVPADRAHTLAQRCPHPEDLIIFFSATSNIYRETIDNILELIPEKRPKTILITMNDKHPIRNKVDRVFWLPNYKNQGYAQYLESQVVFMVFVDLLTSYIADLQVE